MGGKGCCFNCIKYTLAVFNFIVLAIGGAVLGLGIYVLVSKYGADKLQGIIGSEDLYKAGVGLLIAGGSVTIIISFLGCCGACMENRVMLGIYFAVMLILTLFFIVVVIIGFVFYERLKTTIKDEAETVLVNKYGRDKKVTESWDLLQEDLQCCGMTGNLNSNKSWAIYKLQTEWFKFQPPSGYTGRNKMDFVPKSCCNLSVSLPYDDCLNYPPIPVGTSAPTYIWTEGCYDKLFNYIKQNGAIIGGIAAAALGVMLIGTIFSIVLCAWIGRSKDFAV